MSDEDLDLVQEQLSAQGRWQRSFWSGQLQRAYETGQADARDGGTSARLRDSSWQTCPSVVSAYWLGFLGSWDGVAICLPDQVRDLPGLAQHLHREAAWSAVEVAHDDTGRPADFESLLAFTVAMVYERAARLVDQLIVGHPDEAQGLWTVVDSDDEQADEHGGLAFTLAADPSGEGVQIRVHGAQGCSGERRFATWWQALATLGGFIHALDADDPVL